MAQPGESDQVESDYGAGASGAGDVNNDGYDDVIVGAPDHQNNFDAEGRIFLYLGGPTGLDTTPVWTFDGQRDQGSLGAVVGQIDRRAELGKYPSHSGFTTANAAGETNDFHRGKDTNCPPSRAGDGAVHSLPLRPNSIPSYAFDRPFSTCRRFRQPPARR